MVALSGSAGIPFQEEAQGYSMTCVCPRTFSNKERGILIQYPCGRCIACRIQKTGEWQTRLLCEMQYYVDTSFITLTYDDDHIPSDRGLVKDHLRNFFKRLRNHVKTPFKHFSVGEYGDLDTRPHYHSLILGWYPSDCFNQGVGKPRFVSPLLSKVWPFGFNTVGVVEQKSIDYVTGYVRKKLYGPPAKELYGDRQPPFQLNSIGIGRRYVEDHKDEILKNKGVVINGRNRGICRYFWQKLDLPQPEEDAFKEEVMRERERKREVEAQVKNLSDNYIWDDRKQKEKNLLAKEKLFTRGVI